MTVLSLCWRGSPAASPSNPSERTRISSRRRKHGTTGQLALPHQNRRYGEIAETVRSAPGRGPTDGGGYKDFERDGKENPRGRKASWGAKPVGRLTQAVRAVSFGPNWPRGRISGPALCQILI